VTRFVYLVRHGEADPPDGPLSRAGEQQARLTGQRLTGVPLSSITYGPSTRTTQTAGLIAASLPNVAVSACDLAGDYLPFVPDPDGLPPSFASFLAGFPAAERARGAELGAAALERFAQPGAGPGDTHDLVVTHNFLIGWLVSQALDAPPWRWMGLNQMNCALTVIVYLPALPPGLISFNDAGHLPPELRWTGFPAAVRPASG